MTGSRTAAEDRALAWTRRSAGALAVPLLAAYAAVLIAVPSDFGPRLFGFVLSPSRMILAALIVILAVGRVLSWRSLGEMPRAVLAGWALFLGAAAVSTALNPTNGSIARYGSLVVEGFFVMWVVGVAVTSRSDARRIVLALLLTTVAVAFATLCLGLTGRSYEGIFSAISGAMATSASVDSRFGFVRQQGSFPAPLFFGLWLTAAGALVLPYLERATPRVRLAACVGWAILFLAVALLTVSRMAITIALAIVGAYFLLRRPRWLGLLALGLALAVATGLASVSWGIPSIRDTASASPSVAPVTSPGTGTVPPSPVPSVSPAVPTASASQGSASVSASPSATAPPPSATSRPSAGPSRPTEAQTLAESNSLRIEAFRAALSAVSQRPWFGWGLLTEKEVVSEIGGRTNFVDSSYLALLVNLGLIGFGAFVFLVLAIVRAALGARDTALGVSLGLATASILLMSGLAAFLVITQGYALTWLVAALTIAMARRRDTGTP